MPKKRLINMFVSEEAYIRFAQIYGLEASKAMSITHRGDVLSKVILSYENKKYDTSK